MKALLKRHWPTLALVAFSAVLLNANIVSRSLWTDEQTSFDFSDGSLSAIIHRTATDVHPPLYYIMLHFWMELFGRTEYAARALSTLFGALAVAAIVGVGTLISGLRLGRLAGALLAVSPHWILCASMIRWYSLAAFLALLSTWSFLQAIRSKQASYWVAYVVVSAILLYTHYLPISVLLVHGLFLLLFGGRDRKMLASWFLSQVCVFVLYLPQITILVRQLLQAPSHGVAAPLAYGWLGLLVKAGYTAYAFCLGGTVLPWNVAVSVPACALFAVLVFGGLSGTFLAGEKKVFLLLSLATPVVFLILLTLTIFPSEGFHVFPGILLFALPSFVLIVACGILNIAKPRTRVLTLVLTLALYAYSLRNYYTGREFINPSYVIPWKTVAGDLSREVSKDDLVVVTDGMLMRYSGDLPMLLTGELPNIPNVKRRIMENPPRELWFEVRDAGDFEGSRWKTDLHDWIANNYGAVVSRSGYVEEDGWTIFFKEKLMKRSVPRYKVTVTQFRRWAEPRAGIAP